MVFEWCEGLTRASAAVRGDRPTNSNLTPLALKSLNSSSKSEFIGLAGAARMGVDHHQPCRFEDRFRAQTLPIGNVEGAIHLREAAVALHDEGGTVVFACDDLSASGKRPLPMVAAR
jgi:hypothetical protein